MKKGARVDNPLLDRVRFVRRAQTGKGPAEATHCILRYGRILASAGKLAAGAPADNDDLDCCPHTDKLIAALEQCAAAHVLAQSAEYLTVRSQGLLGEFQGDIPLLRDAKLSTPVPDPPHGILSEGFRLALATVGNLTKESARTVLESCVQLDNGSCVATNGYVILQAWHGCGMPSGLLVPKSFVDAVAKIRLTPKSFGFSATSFTVHYEGDCWLRTELYSERIPDMASKFIESSSTFALPNRFFDAVDVVAKWSEDERIYLFDDSLHSHPKGSRSSLTYAEPMPELRQGISYRVADLRTIAKLAKRFDSNHDTATMFYGDNLRGVIAHRLIAGDQI